MLTLRKKNSIEYESWLISSLQTYKEEIITNGFTEEEADKKANEDFERHLPSGIDTPDQYIYTVLSGDTIIGTIWFGIRGAEKNRKAFIYDIIIDADHRGKGHGSKVINLLEVEVKKLGLKHIGLHVFGHNTVARAMYEKLGYAVTNLNLEKVLD